MADRCPKCSARGFLSGEDACKACGWRDPILEPWVRGGWYVDPANPERARYYNSHGRIWVGKSRKDPLLARHVPTEPPRQWLESNDPARKPFAVVNGLTVLGGDGFHAAPGSVVRLAFLPAAIVIDCERDQCGEVPYADVMALEIGGRGERKEGGGFFGGGFGVEGAAEGMLVASALNMLTTRTKIDTVVCLQTPSAELFLHCSSESPNALRMRLSRVFTLLRARSAPTPGASAGAADQLAKLADMLEKGLLTREEFDAMKRSMLTGLDG